jgi:putative ABC transport system permease protein
MDALKQDLRFGLRLLARTPGVLVTAVLALALGIGANSAVFSLVYNVLLKPLPYPEPDRVVAIYDTQPALKTAPASYPKYIDWRDQNRVFDAVGGSVPSTSVLTGAGDPERIRTSRTTASLFRVFAVQPQLGRWFREDEDKPGGANVTLLSYGFWERRFARDPSIVGRTITLDDIPRTVVGVMPQGFAHNRADAFVPLAMALDEKQRGSHFLGTYGRLKRGVTVGQARRDMVALGHRLAREHGTNHGIDVRSYSEAVIGDARRPLLILLASVALVLLIACVNVANLLLARSTARRKEIAVRTAVGASRGRLARQLLTESLILAIAGGALGLLLAWGGVRAFVAAAPPVLPRMASIALDGYIVAFTFAIAVCTGIVFGLAPVLHARDGGFGDALKEETGRATGGRTSRRAADTLVVVEVALSLVLLVAAGLMVKSLLRLEQQDIGVAVERVLAFDVSLPHSRYGDDDKVRAFYRDALERIAASPGVVSVGATSGLPLYGYGTNGDFEIEGKTLWKPSEAPLAELRAVAADYFKTLGVPLVRGRLFTSRDDERARPVAVINRVMAERFWPNEDPIGKRIKIWSYEWHEIVGVVGDVRTYNPARPAMIEVSFPFAQKASGSMTIVVRSAGESAALTAAMRRQIAAIDPTQPLANIQTMEEVVRTSLARPRLFSVLTSGFAALAGLLAMIGVYGLIAYAVSQQTREFGIRMAMGADATAVLCLVLGRGLKLALAGTALGAVAAIAATRLLRSMLFNVAPTDPLVFGAACAAMVLAASAACLVPARAAARTDPVVTLKA